MAKKGEIKLIYDNLMYIDDIKVFKLLLKYDPKINIHSNYNELFKYHCVDGSFMIAKYIYKKRKMNLT